MGDQERKRCVKLGEFIAKYWLEVFFGLICAGVAGTIKYLIKSFHDERDRRDQKLITSMEKSLKASNDQLKADMDACSIELRKIVADQTEALKRTDELIHDEIDGLRDGMLSVQGRNFKNDCHKLLQEGHIITALEYEQALADHIVYNKLGGNHEGDALFGMVETKYKNTIGK